MAFGGERRAESEKEKDLVLTALLAFIQYMERWLRLSACTNEAIACFWMLLSDVPSEGLRERLVRRILEKCCKPSAPYWLERILGSKASRNTSPSELKASTLNKIINPG